MARKRIDPKSTAPDGGAANPERILNRKRDRYYTWANPNDEDTGCASYEADGYVFERREEGGVIVPRGSTKEDGIWTFKGQKLMSCDLADREAIVAAGQANSDGIDQRMLKRGNIEDGLRGRGYQLGVDPRESAPFAEEGA